jgi:hypothetical protein
MYFYFILFFYTVATFKESMTLKFLDFKVKFKVICLKKSKNAYNSNKSGPILTMSSFISVSS